MEAGVAVLSCGVIACLPGPPPFDGVGCVFLHDCVTSAIEKNHLRLLLFPSTAKYYIQRGNILK